MPTKGDSPVGSGISPHRWRDGSRVHAKAVRPPVSAATVLRHHRTSVTGEDFYVVAPDDGGQRILMARQLEALTPDVFEETYERA